MTAFSCSCMLYWETPLGLRTPASTTKFGASSLRQAVGRQNSSIIHSIHQKFHHDVSNLNLSDFIHFINPYQIYPIMPSYLLLTITRFWFHWIPAPKEVAPTVFFGDLPGLRIRSVAANSYDSTYCSVLGQMAVHGAMAGYSGITAAR